MKIFCWANFQHLIHAMHSQNRSAGESIKNSIDSRSHQQSH